MPGCMLTSDQQLGTVLTEWLALMILQAAAALPALLC